jgi:hypothetical protein
MSGHEDAPRTDGAAPPRRPYATPVLTVFGGVASLTSTQTMSGTNMDGGPNNSKT